MSFREKRVLLKTLRESQFDHHILIWMLHNRRLNQKTNYLHEGSFRIVNKDNYSSYMDFVYKEQIIYYSSKNSSDY